MCSLGIPTRIRELNSRNSLDTIRPSLLLLCKWQLKMPGLAWLLLNKTHNIHSNFSISVYRVFESRKDKVACFLALLLCRKRAI